MLMQVIRSDNQYDYVQDDVLDSLIAAGKIIKFRRSTGWITVGTHPIREHGRERAAKDKDKNAVTFAGEYRKAYLSSLTPF
jgi:hypothetical protein